VALQNPRLNIQALPKCAFLAIVPLQNPPNYPQESAKNRPPNSTTCTRKSRAKTSKTSHCDWEKIPSRKKTLAATVFVPCPRTFVTRLALPRTARLFKSSSQVGYVSAQHRACHEKVPTIKTTVPRYLSLPAWGLGIDSIFGYFLGFVKIYRFSVYPLLSKEGLHYESFDRR
jgi:hypothetical protein